MVTLKFKEMNLSQQLIFFVKEFKTNKFKITKVFFTIFVSFLIFSSIIILKNSIENEITRNSKVFLGGDVELSTKNKALDPGILGELEKNFHITEVIEFTSIIKKKNGESKTVRIKSIDNLYPLNGEVLVTPSDSFEILRKSSDNNILVDRMTKNNLALEIGDSIEIQNSKFKVVGIIDSLPDIGGIFLFGDQALINSASLKSLKINNLGSFVSYKYKLLKKNNTNEIQAFIGKIKNVKIKYPEDLSENLKKAIENFIFFLSIISASAILISGIGLKNSLFSFLSSNKFKIAIFKSMGLSSQNIKMTYYLQSFFILILSAFFSYIFGLLIISLFDYSFLKFLDIKLEATFSLNEYLIILFFIFIVFFIFAKPVLDSIDQIKVADLFRNSSTHLNLKYSKKSILEISIFLIIFVFSFCVLSVKTEQTAIFFFFFMIMSFFYYFLSKIYIYLFSKVKNFNNLAIEISIKNLIAFKGLNSIVVITMGLGVTVLLFLGILSSNIKKELSSSIPENAPDYFFLGLQNNELDIFSEEIYKIDNKAKPSIVPMISARIETINKKKPKDFVDEKNDSFWFVNGDRRISWSKKPPSNNTVLKGKWWYLDKANTLEISLDNKVAQDLNLKIGDSMKFNIYGNSVSGIITNFREVDYRDLNINFAILFNPNFASQIPHEYMSTVKFEKGKSISLSDLLKKLPNITYISLSEYIGKTKNFLNKLFIVCILISSLVILIGLIVISNAVSVIGHLKVYQNLVFRILGFENSNIYKIILLESLILFLPVMISSMIFASSFSYVFVNNFLGIDWYFSINVLLTISFLFFSLLIFTLLISNRKYLNLNSYSLLRNG